MCEFALFAVFVNIIEQKSSLHSFQLIENNISVVASESEVQMRFSLIRIMGRINCYFQF